MTRDLLCAILKPVRNDEVFALFDRGYDTKAVAKELGIKKHSAETYQSAWKKKHPTNPETGDKGQKPENADNPPREPERPTTSPSDATKLRLIPKILTIDYTPIMMMAQRAAIIEWDWPEDMPPDDFFDTILYHAFKDRGIILQGYVNINHNKEV